MAKQVTNNLKNKQRSDWRSTTAGGWLRRRFVVICSGWQFQVLSLRGKDVCGFLLGAEHAKAGVGVGLVQLQQLLGDLEEGILDTWQHTFCITASVLCFSLLSLATHFLHYYFSIALLSMYQNHWQHSFYTNRFCAGLLSSFILSDAKQLLHYWFGIVLLSSFFLSDAKQFLLTDQYCTTFFRLSVSITGNTASTLTDSA